MKSLNMENINHSGKSVRLLLRRSVRCIRTNQFDDAIKFIDEVLERQPENKRANALKFTAYYMSKQYEKARLVGSKAASLNPKSEYILNNHACLQLNKGFAQEAEGLIDSLVIERGENSQWLYNLGLAHAQLGKYELAIDTFNRVLDIEPSYYRALLQRASVELKLGLHESAYQTLNILRFITKNQHTSGASHIFHGIRFNQLDQESLQQEIAIWGDQYIPKSRAYENKPIDTTKPYKLGFVVGAIPKLEWNTIVWPLINELAKNEHQVSVYWHQTGILPIAESSNISIKNCRKVSDADFARLCREAENDFLIDIGGMHTLTRERTFGINLANKQFAWLTHAGIFSTALMESLDEKLGTYRFAVVAKTVQTKQENNPSNKMPRNAIAAIGCEAGLSLKTVKTWSKILKQSSKKLALDVHQEAIQQQLLKRFALYGIDQKQITFVTDIEFKPGHIVLENLDYNAIAKASQAVISGANVITMSGELFPAQRTANLLQHIGKKDWVCDNEHQYIATVLDLIDSKYKNSKIKSQIKSSEIENISNFAEHFLTTLTKTI